MKQLISILAIALLVGCTTFNHKASNLIVTTSEKVDCKMNSWTISVLRGKVNHEQDAHVRMAYRRYQASMISGTNAYAALVLGHNTNAWAKASQVITNSSAALLQLITAFTPTNTTPH